MKLGEGLIWLSKVNKPLSSCACGDEIHSSINLVAANITDPPDDVTVTAPGAVSFTCTASGVPRPNVTWFSPSSVTLVSGNNGVTTMEMMEEKREIVSTLSIATTAPSVAGQYRCVAENGVTGVGDVNDITALLMVYGKSCMDSKDTM